MNRISNLIVTGMLTLITSAAGAVDQGAYTTGELEVFSLSQQKFDAGAASRSDVLFAQLDFRDAQLATGEVSKSKYCQLAPATAGELLKVVRSRYELGAGTMLELVAAQKAVRQTRANCK